METVYILITFLIDLYCKEFNMERRKRFFESWKLYIPENPMKKQEANMIPTKIMKWLWYCKIKMMRPTKQGIINNK